MRVIVGSGINTKIVCLTGSSKENQQCVDDKVALKVIRSDDDLKSEVAKLTLLINKVRPKNNLGDSNYSLLDCEINFLTKGDITHDLSWPTTLFSIQNLKDWLTDVEEEACSSLWEISL